MLTMKRKSAEQTYTLSSAGRLFPRLADRFHADGSGVVRWQCRAAVPEPGVYALQAHADVVMHCHTVEYRVEQWGPSICTTAAFRCGRSVPSRFDSRTYVR